MENVFTGRSLWACINATTVDESIPPERKAPRGTSATIRRRTASRSRVSRCSTASTSVFLRGLATPLSATSLADQKGTGYERSLVDDERVKIVPGVSL